MARKTKADTEQTRLHIIDAARQVFSERGVSRTTFAEIAKAAGVTRGAIYWHFASKRELFFAMREQVSLPLIDRVDKNSTATSLDDPLQNIHSTMCAVLNMLEEDVTTRTTLEIVIFKCEYVDEFSSINTQVMKAACNFMEQLTKGYETAHRNGQLRGSLDPTLLALDSYSFMKGLINLWLANPEDLLIRQKARALIEAHIATRRG